MSTGLRLDDAVQQALCTVRLKEKTVFVPEWYHEILEFRCKSCSIT